MLNNDVCRYNYIDVNELPEDIQNQILEVQEQTGFIPNVFLTLARRPDEFRAFFDYYQAIMSREANLSLAEKEMIIVSTSALNGCQYCVVAHGAVLRIITKEPLLADKLGINHRHCDISPRQKAILDFCIKLSRQPEEIEQQDYEVLYKQGLDDEDIWDISSICAFFGLSNRMAIITAMQPNPEFYTMGR